MAEKLIPMHGTASEANAYTGAAGEISTEQTENTFRLHDGTTQGGHIMAKKTDLISKTGAVTGDVPIFNEITGKYEPGAQTGGGTSDPDPNNAPVVNNQTLSVETSNNLVIILGPLTDSDGETVTYTATGGSGYSITTNELTFNSNSAGTQIITITGTDTQGAFDTGTLTINVSTTPVNNSPVVLDQNLSTTTDTNLVITLGPLTDNDGESVTYTATGSSDFSITNNIMTFNTSSVSTQTITVTGSDGALSGQGTLTIGVTLLNPSAPVIPDQLSLTVVEGENLLIVLGPLTDADGDTIIYTAAGSSDFTISGRIMTFNSNTVGSVTMAVTGNDNKGKSDSGTVRVDVTAINANRLPVVNDQTLSTTVGSDLVITLGPATDADGDSVAFTVTGSSNYLAGASSNEIVYNGPVEAVEVLTVTASDGIGVDVTATITITVTEAVVTIPTRVAYSGWSTMSYYMNGYNTASSTAPSDEHNPSVYKMVGQMYLANNIAGYVDDFNFIPQGADNINGTEAKAHTAATSATVAIYSAYGSTSGITADPAVANAAPGAGSTGWIDRMVDISTDAEARGITPIMYQAWPSSDAQGSIGNALINSDQLQAKHGMLIIRTAEIMEELGNINPAYVINSPSAGSVNFLPPVTHLFSGGNDTFHASYGMALVNALATFKCLTGISAADNLFEVPSGGSAGTKYGMPAQFITDIKTAVDTIQQESIVSGLADGAIPIASDFTRNGTQSVEGKINIPAASNLKDDTPIVASRMVITTITAGDFIATDLTNGVFTYTPRADLVGNTVVVFTYTDTTNQTKDITLTLTVGAAVVIPPQEIIINFGAGNYSSLTTNGNLYNHGVTSGGKVINGIRQFDNPNITAGSLQDTDGNGIGSVTTINSGGLNGGGYGGNSGTVTDVYAPYPELDANGSAVLNNEIVKFKLAGVDPGTNYRIQIGGHWGGGTSIPVSVNVGDVIGTMNCNSNAHVTYDKVVKASSAGEFLFELEGLLPSQEWGLSFVVLNKITDGTPAATPSAVTYTLEPLDISTIAGETVTFKTGVSSESSGQWYRDDVLMNGETAFDLSVTTTAGHNGSIYKRTATNAGGVTTSRLATLSILTTAPIIDTQPISGVTRIEGEPFTIISESTGATSYQWQKDGVDIVGELSPTYSSNAILVDSGSLYTCIHTNGYGSTTTSSFTLTVTVKNDQYWITFGSGGGPVQNYDAGFSNTIGNGPSVGGEAMNWIRGLRDIGGTKTGMWRNDSNVITDLSLTYTNPEGGGNIDGWSNIDTTAAADPSVIAALQDKGLYIHTPLWDTYSYLSADDVANFVFSQGGIDAGSSWRVQIVAIHYRESTNDNGAIDITLNGNLFDTGGRSQPWADVKIFDETVMIGVDGLLTIKFDPKGNTTLNAIRLLKVSDAPVYGDTITIPNIEVL